MRRRPATVARARRSRSRTRSRVEHAAVPTLRFALRIDSRDGRRHPLGPARHADPDRRARGGATTRPRTSACSSCSARPRTGARRCARCSGRARRVVVPPFTGATLVDLPRRRAPTTSRSPPRATSTRSTTARCRSSSCSAARVFYAGDDGRLQTTRDLVGGGGRVPPAGRGVARDDGPPLPRARRGCGCGAERSTGCCAYQAARTRWRPGRTRSTRCSEERGP